MAVLICDTEVYKNFFLCAFKRIDNGKIFTYGMFDGQDLDRKSIAAILERHTIVTFNGLAYDAPMLALALTGANCASLKAASDDIIQHRMKPWEFERAYGITIPTFDHIDLIETAPGVAIGLKTYAGRLHCQKMQDLPYPHDAVLTRDEMDHVRLYCVNDLDNTESLFHSLAEPLALRVAMGKQYNFDFRSKSDAQVSEQLIRIQLKKVTGSAPTKAPKIAGIQFKYQIPAWIKYDNPALNEILDKLREHTFITKSNGTVDNPDFLKETPINIGGLKFKMGIGGLHSQEFRQKYESDEKWMIIDSDVTSYYPNIILTLKLFPKHLGEPFLKAFADIVNTRTHGKVMAGKLKKLVEKLEKDTLEYAKTEKERVHYQNIADSLKIAVNGIFGKTGSQYSIVFSPDLMIQTTITGQLDLLLLAEWFDKVGIKVISGNTDGIVVYVERERAWVVSLLTHEWEILTSLEMERSFYAGLYSRDVNNYIAIKANGSTKGKGAFANPMAENDIRGQLQKNPESAICVEAAVARIHKGTPVWETIRACKDIRKFVTVRKESSGAYYDGEYLGKVVRWYYGHTSVGCITGSRNDNRVAKSDGAVPLMDLPKELPHDLNYDYYIQEALYLLEDMAYHPVVDEKSVFATFFRKSVLGMKR